MKTDDPVMISSLEWIDENLKRSTDLTINIARYDYRYDKIECLVCLASPCQGRKTQRRRLKVSALSSELSTGSNRYMFPYMTAARGFELPKSLMEEFATEMGSTIRAHSALVQNLTIFLDADPGANLLLQKMCAEIFDDRWGVCSLFPSLRHTHLALMGDPEVELCPKLMRHVRGLTIASGYRKGKSDLTQAHNHIAWARAIHEKVRKYEIEVLRLGGFSGFQCPRLLADVLGGVSSIWIELMNWDDASVFTDALELLAKANSVNPQQIRIRGNRGLDPRWAEFMTTLLRLRPNLLALKIDEGVLMTKENCTELFGVISRVGWKG